MGQQHKSYTIIVPLGISSGETFPVDIEGKTMLVTCPEGSGEGSKLHAKIITTSPQSQVTLSKPPIQRRSPITSCVVYWAVLELSIFILTTLSYSLSPFAIQRVSDICNVVNTKTGLSIGSIYYFTFDGISSSSVSCTDSDNQFW